MSVSTLVHLYVPWEIWGTSICLSGIYMPVNTIICSNLQQLSMGSVQTHMYIWLKAPVLIWSLNEIKQLCVVFGWVTNMENRCYTIFNHRQVVTVAAFLCSCSLCLMILELLLLHLRQLCVLVHHLSVQQLWWPLQAQQQLQLRKMWFYMWFYHRYHWPHHCGTAATSVPGAFSGIYQLHHGSSAGFPFQSGPFWFI